MMIYEYIKSIQGNIFFKKYHIEIRVMLIRFLPSFVSAPSVIR